MALGNTAGGNASTQSTPKDDLIRQARREGMMEAVAIADHYDTYVAQKIIEGCRE